MALLKLRCVVLLIGAALGPGLIAVNRANANSAAEIPPVAIHVSEATAAHWNKLGGPHADWKYWHTWGFLMEAFHGDGTRYIRITDADVQQGKLLQDGRPAFPIVFSLASACIADRTASQFDRYLRSGGHVYLGSTAWTRSEDGDPRTLDGKAVFAVAGIGLAPRYTSLDLALPSVARLHRHLYQPFVVWFDAMDTCERLAERERTRGNRATCARYDPEQPGDFWPPDRMAPT